MGDGLDTEGIGRRNRVRNSEGSRSRRITKWGINQLDVKFIYVFVYLRFDSVRAYITSNDWMDDQWTLMGKDVGKGGCDII
jgi:hypothetical protein